MVEGKCIYCKEIKELNEEHAFPQFLLQKCAPLNKCAPEWVIRKLCVECNGSKLGKLDDTLATKSPMGFIWRIIKSEWQAGENCKSQNTTFYNARGFDGILPVRLFYPDCFYDNLIVLHEEMGTSTPDFFPTLLGRARVPQMIVICYNEEQTAEDVVAKNFEKWVSREMSIEEDDEYKGVYNINDNSYVFDPQAVKSLIANPDREREYVAKFMKKRENIRVDLRVLFPDNRNDAGQLEGFCRRFSASTMEEFEAKRFEPKEATENYVMVAADKKAIPYSKRAIAKIAFHCFLYWHPEFNGDEPIFEGIRTFISENGNHQTLNGEDFMTGLSVPSNYFWPSNEHFHILRFLVHDDNIICQIVFFTGLWLNPSCSEIPEPLACEIILAGDSEKAQLGNPEERRIPFYVHGKSQLKRRILPISYYPQMILA